MGMQTEFNWYIVVKKPFYSVHDMTIEKTIQLYQQYMINKEDYRVYPMDTPLPFLYNGKCLGMVTINTMSWNDKNTMLFIEPTIVFEENDPVAQYYEDQFRIYKEEQERIDDGGKIDLRQIVNPKERVRV